MMVEKKRVLLVYYKLFKAGGLPKVFSSLANELVLDGYGVDILLMMKEQPDFYPINPQIKRHNINTFSHWSWQICEFNIKYFHFVPKIRNLNAYIYHIGVFLMMRNWMRENHKNYDTIVSSFYKLTTLLSINKKVNYKTICWENVDYNIGGVLYRDLLRRFYKNLKGIVCTNKPSVQYYQKLNKTTLITNIIGSPFEDKKNIDLTSKENIITVIGRLDEEKNVIELLQIIKEAQLPHDWYLNVIGDGVEMENLQHYVKENQLQNKIKFLGIKNVEEIYGLLLKSKIFAFTSVKEGLPTVLLEAMFCGNALISYDCNYGPADILTDKNGFLVPLYDKKAFIEKLQLLINDEPLLSQYMKNSFEESKNWKKEEIIKKWEAVL